MSPSRRPLPPLPSPATELAWAEPLDLARALVAEHSTLSLLYDPAGRSFLAVNPQRIVTDSWEDITTDAFWIGYLGYESREVSVPPQPLGFPALWMAQFATVFVFEHKEKTLTGYGSLSPWGRGWRVAPGEGLEGNTEDTPHPSDSRYRALHSPSPPRGEGMPLILPRLKTLTSNMSKAEYLTFAAATIAQINKGEFYQANLTRKFTGQFAEAPSPLDLFCTLAQLSPGQYSALLMMDDRAVVSSSPECFLTLEAGGKVISRPIKGTARRSGDAAQDERIRNALAASTKNRSENLMIVDLMRNDLAQSCMAGSVKVDALYQLTEHPHLYHLVSQISGQRRAEASALDVIGGCFPPGSMTGAPKKAAINWCKTQEKLARGVYSGALGWIGADGSADLSVVIRTLLLHGTQFEFQVGGGIVADSTPEDEWQETLTKASALCKALGIEPEQLAAL